MLFSKISILKCTIPKFAGSTIEIEDFSSVESWFILLQKIAFKFRENPNCHNDKSEEAA